MARHENTAFQTFSFGLLNQLAVQASPEERTHTREQTHRPAGGHFRIVLGHATLVVINVLVGGGALLVDRVCSRFASSRALLDVGACIRRASVSPLLLSANILLAGGSCLPFARTL